MSSPLHHDVEAARDGILRGAIIGADKERARIAKAQAGALRNLRVLVGSCSTLCPAWGGPPRVRHAEDCELGIVVDAIKQLRAATRGPR
jgi:hypothetical protein